MNGRQPKYEQPHKRRLRECVEAELSAIPTLDPRIAGLISAEGFIDYYLQMENLYSSQREAYERLEDFHITVTGRRRYSEYNSFRKVLYRQLQKYRK